MSKLRTPLSACRGDGWHKKNSLELDLDQGLGSVNPRYFFYWVGDLAATTDRIAVNMPRHALPEGVS